jgi:hypothetical protein
MVLRNAPRAYRRNHADNLAAAKRIGSLRTLPKTQRGLETHQHCVLVNKLETVHNVAVHWNRQVSLRYERAVAPNFSLNLTRPGFGPPPTPPPRVASVAASRRLQFAPSESLRRSRQPSCRTDFGTRDRPRRLANERWADGGSTRMLRVPHAYGKCDVIMGARCHAYSAGVSAWVWTCRCVRDSSGELPFTAQFRSPALAKAGKVGVLSLT